MDDSLKAIFDMIDEELQEELWSAYHRPGYLPIEYRRYAAGALPYSNAVHFLWYTIEADVRRSQVDEYMAWRSLCGRVVIGEPGDVNPLRSPMDVGDDEWCGLCKQYGIPRKGGADMVPVQSQGMTQDFTLVKETTRTYRYEEVTEPGREPVIGTVYVKKWLFGNEAPEKIRVDISPV